MKGGGKAVLYSPANEVEIFSTVERFVYLMRQKENQEDEVVGKPGKAMALRRTELLAHAAEPSIKIIGVEHLLS